MAFNETAIFPKCVSLGALSKPRYKTSVIPRLSGHTSRNVEWAQPLHAYDFAHTMTQEQHESLLAFFHAAQGAGHQFRVHDPADYNTTTANGVLIGLAPSEQLIAVAGTGFGYGTLIAGKRYAAGSLSTYRILQKLVAGTVRVYRAGTLVVEGASAGQIAVDATTGKITFVADQNRSIASHTVGASHVLTLASAFSPNFALGNRVYVSGVSSGTAASILNGYSHEITNISGAQLTIDLDTTGLTAGGGTAYFFPQSTQTLTLECEFHVPCSFSSDEAAFDRVDTSIATGGGIWQWSGINLEEERLALPAPSAP